MTKRGVRGNRRGREEGRGEAVGREETIGDRKKYISEN